MDKQQALHQFWSSFGWAAYDENTVPDNAMERFDGHYITYSVVTSALDEPIPISANLWMRDTSWAAITQKANAISAVYFISHRLTTLSFRSMTAICGYAEGLRSHSDSPNRTQRFGKSTST